MNEHLVNRQPTAEPRNSNSQLLPRALYALVPHEVAVLFPTV